MLNSDPILESHFRRLHPRAIEDPTIIRSLFQRLERERIPLRRGMNRRIDPETALIDKVDDDVLVLRTRNFERDRRPFVFLNFAVDGVPYFFAAERLGDRDGDRLRVRLPAAVYRAERRDRTRTAAENEGPSLQRVVVTAPGLSAIEGEIENYSPEGLAVRVPTSALPRDESDLRVRFHDRDGQLRDTPASVRHRRPLADRPGWLRIGLNLRGESSGPAIRVERRSSILETSSWRQIRQGWSFLSQSARLASSRTAQRLLRRPPVLPEVRPVRYRNDKGEELAAIIDATGDTRGAPAVILPPAWGRTKETLLPLARTIVATFRAARRPVVVIRFDGIRKRGESHNDPECRAPGSEHHHFTFSQGVRDIQATLDFLEAAPDYRPSTTILVTLSAAALEGRKAIAFEGGRRLGGWVSVVGPSDLQSMMRVISGGVDYVAGVERGVQFGLQEVLGVVVDIDLAGVDALAHGLAFLEDGRRDMAGIEVPITWFDGRYDAWMDVARVREILSVGDTSRRRLIEIPTGHQLKSSREALATFQGIAIEVGRMVGAELVPTVPDLAEIEGQRQAERRRRPAQQVDLRSFWRDYLVGRHGGRDGALGIELMSTTAAYRGLMRAQIEALHLRAGDRIGDFGSGTGAFALHLLESASLPGGLRVDQFDYVREALARGRRRLDGHASAGTVGLRQLECDLDVRPGGLRLPVRDESYDAVLASLLVSYVKDPPLLLREIRRVLKPGGRLVLSSLKRDADISKIYVEGFDELRAGLARERFDEAELRQLDASARTFLNDAARLLDLEESGAFCFWEPEELARLVRRAGFRQIETGLSFGEPPQAVVLSAVRA